MLENTWRERCRPRVPLAISDGKMLGLEGRDLLKFCYQQFPFGPREMHPYRIWQSEVREQLGLPKIRRKKRRQKRSPDLPGQGLLF